MRLVVSPAQSNTVDYCSRELQAELSTSRAALAHAEAELDASVNISDVWGAAAEQAALHATVSHGELRAEHEEALEKLR